MRSVILSILAATLGVGMACGAHLAHAAEVAGGPRLAVGPRVLGAKGDGAMPDASSPGQTGALVTPGYWTIEAGGFDRLEDLLAFADDDIWAVGDGVAHFDGQGWRQVAGLEAPHLYGVDGFGDDALWAVGESGLDCGSHGVAFRRVDGAWEPLDVETDVPLYDVAMLSPTDGWAVGGVRDAVILHFDGVAWRRASAPEVGALRSMHLLSSSDGWAVGRDGAIAHFNGLRWEAVSSPTDGLLTGVHFFEEGKGWAVGIESSGGVILTYQGGRWLVDADLLPVALTTVRAVAPHEAFAAGQDGVLLFYDGTDWREIGRTYPRGIGSEGADPGAAPPPPIRVPSRTASGTDADGQRLRSDGGVVVDGGIGPDPEPFLADIPALRGAIILPNGEDVMLVGDNGQVVTIEVLVPREVRNGWSYTAIDMLSATDGWAVSRNGPPVHWDGTAWTEVDAPMRLHRFLDVAAISHDLVWAVGRRGAVGRWDGSQWEELPAFANLDLVALAFSTPNDGWAVGNEVTYDEEGSQSSHGAVFHFDGSVCNQVLSLCYNQLYDIAAATPSDVWVAAASNNLLHFDGSRWSWVPVASEDGAGATAAAFLSVDLTADGGGWAGGYYGLARRTGPLEWRSVTPWNAGHLLYALDIAAVDRDHAWVNNRAGVDYYGPAGVEHALTSGLSIAAIAAAPGPTGKSRVWAVAGGGTIAELTAFDDAHILAPVSPTPPMPTAVPFPTSTPFSANDPGDVIEAIATQAIGLDADSLTVQRLELMNVASWQNVVADEVMSMEAVNGWSYYSGDKYLCSDPAWLAVFHMPPVAEGDSPDYYLPCDDVANTLYVGMLDRTLRPLGLFCGLRWSGVAYFPALYSAMPPGRATPTPRPPTQTPPPLMTQPAVNRMDGPCPTLTPYPTSDWPGYPGP